MTPEHAAEFEADFPQYKMSSESNVTVLSPKIAEAYRTGKMTPEHSAELEADMKAGLVKLPPEPAAPVIESPSLPGDMGVGTDMAQVQEAAALEPELQGRDISAAPESWRTLLGQGLASAAGANVPGATPKGTPQQADFMFGDMLSTGVEDTVKAFKSAYPNITVDKDETGNYFYISPQDGQKTYFKKGMDTGDVLKGIMTTAAFAPVNEARGILQAAGGNAAVQALIEKGKQYFGQDSSLLNVGIAGALGGAADYVAGKFDPKLAKDAILPTREYTEKQIGDILRLARRGDEAATKELARIFSAKPELVKQFQDAGIDLPASVLAENPHIRRGAAYAANETVELDQLGKDLVGVKDQIDNLIDKSGNARNVVELNNIVKTELKGEVEKIGQVESFRNRVLENLAPKNTPATLINTENTLKALVDEVGEGFLSKEEKELLSMIGRNKKGSSFVNEQGLMETVPEVTYGSLQRVRSDIGAALGGSESMFSNVNRGALKRLYGALKEDQKLILKNIGGDDAIRFLENADVLTQQRIAIQDNVLNLYGKKGEKSIASLINNAIGNVASKGDDVAFRKLIDNIPDENLKKQTVVSSILSTLKDKTEDELKDSYVYFSKFNDMYTGLRKNPGLYNEIINVVGKDFGDTLTSIYQMSESILRNKKDIGGALPSDSALAKKMMLSNRFLNALSTTIGRGFTAGFYKMSGMLVGSQGISRAILDMGTSPTEVQQQINTLFRSPEFKKLVTDYAVKGEVSNGVIKQFAGSKGFKEYAKSLGIEPQFSARETAVRAMIQSFNEQMSDTMTKEENKGENDE